MKRTASTAALLGLAFEHAAHPAIVVDPAADAIVDANLKAAALLGLPRAALAAMRATALHPGQMPALLVFTEAVILKGAYWTQSLSPRHADGRLLKLEYSATLLPAKGGPWLLVEMHDIAERQRRIVNQEADLFMRCGLNEWQRAERFFQDIERENRLILSAAGDGIYGVNRDGITTFLNPAAERMLGWKAAEIVGREMHRTVHHTHADGSGYPNEACPIYAAFRDGEVHKVDNEVFSHGGGPHFRSRRRGRAARNSTDDARLAHEDSRRRKPQVEAAALAPRPAVFGFRSMSA